MSSTAALEGDHDRFVVVISGQEGAVVDLVVRL
jgi:hypothetical protein